MFYLFVPPKWKLRLLVFDCIILAITLVQFANFFDASTKVDKIANKSDAATTNQLLNDNDGIVIDSQKIATLLEQAANKMDKPESGNSN